MRVERIGAATLYLGDAREVMAALPRPAAYISDPPYGMKWNADTTRFSGGNEASRGRRGAGLKGRPIASDDRPFDPCWMADGADAVTLWGCNHFGQRLPVGTTLVWIKRLEGGYGSFLSDAELAWEKGGHGVYCKRDTSMFSVAGNRVHPAQKPVGIMRWCIDRWQLSPESVVADPYMGSASTAIAALDAGMRFVGVETDPVYFEVACKRVDDHQRQGNLFAA